MRRDPPGPDVTAAFRGDQNRSATVAAPPLRAAGAGARIVVLGLAAGIFAMYRRYALQGVR